MRSIKGRKHLTFEEMHLAQWLYIILKKEVEHLVVCNPVFVASRPGSKDDFPDALHLARQLRGGHLIPVYHDESHWIQFRTLVYGYMGLIEEMVRSKNRLKAVFRSEAIDTSESNFYEVAREKCKELSHESGKFVAENLFWQIEGLEKRKREYLERLRLNSKKYKPIRNLMTIPGISIVRASMVSAIVCTPHRFKNKHQFWAYCMLARHFQRSDGVIYGNKKIHGRADLKQVFLGAAESAMRSEGSFRKYYERLCKQGTGYEEAKRALARKIAAIVVDIRRFPKIGHLLSYCCLVKHDKMSGGKSYGKRASRFCRPLKQAFKLAIWSALQGKGNNPFRKYYEFLIHEQAKPEHVARNAVCRKMATAVYGVLKSNKKFNPDSFGGNKKIQKNKEE